MVRETRALQNSSLLSALRTIMRSRLASCIGRWVHHTRIRVQKRPSRGISADPLAPRSSAPRNSVSIASAPDSTNFYLFLFHRPHFGCPSLRRRRKNATLHATALVDPPSNSACHSRTSLRCKKGHSQKLGFIAESFPLQNLELVT